MLLLTFISSKKPALLKTIIANSLIRSISTPVVTLDVDLILMEYSNAWISEFKIPSSNLVGTTIFEILPDLPSSFNSIFKDCLASGSTHSSEGEKFYLSDKSIQWLKWDISVIRSNEDTIVGLLVQLEDITKRKREEELLHKAEKVARIGAWEVDLIANKVYWTEITKSIHEVPKDFVPNLEEGINFYKKGKDRENITDLVSNAIADGTPWDTELQIVTAKGNEIWVHAKGEAEQVDGTTVRLFGTFQDIDASKKKQLEYEAISERLQIATDGAKVGIWDYDIVENVLIWDATMYRLYGIQEKDFSGVYEAWEASVHPEDNARAQDEISQAIAGIKEFDTEFRVVWPNKEVRTIRAIAVSQKDESGKIIKLIGTNWDITELKRAKEELFRNEESFLGAFDKSAAGMALVSKEGSWIKVNDSLCKSIGYTRQELKKIHFKEFTHPEDFPRDLKLWKELLEGKRSSYQIEKRYYHKKGHLIYVVITVTAVKDIYGDFSHCITQILDVTSRKEAEKKLTSLVEITKDQNASLLNFAHIVSHNLRSHATNLSMLTGFLKDEKDEVEQKNLSVMMSNASESLNETVTHLNEVVQVKTGAMEKMKSIHLLPTITNVKSNINAMLKEKGAVCALKIGKSHAVQAVPAYLESILLNLFTNALKYSSPDRKPKINISSGLYKDMVVLKFADNGLGIDLERHGKKLFGMYKTFHVHKEARGIGLFITKNQVESMNGKIEVASEVGVGTTFTIYFEKG